MEIIKFKVGDLIELKKPHPCGSKQFKVLRVGSEMRIVCEGCGRDMNIDRLKLEKATKKRFPAQDTSNEEKGDF